MTNRSWPQPPITILHISDIHVEGIDQVKMLSQLTADVQRLIANFGLKPNLIVASGDLTQRASSSEFEKVTNQLDKMSSSLGLSRQQVVIIPGNHDIDWIACKKIFDGFSDPEPPYPGKWKNYSTFYDTFYGEKRGADHHFTLAQPWSLFEFPAINTVVAGVNSTWAESHRDEDHYGWIGDTQIAWFQQKLTDYQNRGWLCATVLHHNIDPQKNDKSSLRDCANFRHDVLSKTNFVLHGHTHLSDANNGLVPPVLATGTASSEMKTRPEETPNQYQLIQIWPDHFKRWARSYSWQMQRWIGDCSVSRSGNEWHEAIASDFRRYFSLAPHEPASSTAAMSFMDAGDTLAAQAMLVIDGQDKDVKNYIRTIQLKQKFGLHSQTDIKTLSDKLSRLNADWNDDEYRDLSIVRIKLLSQSGLWNDVAKEEKKFPALLAASPINARGFLHRVALAEAILKGYSDRVRQLFDDAITISDTVKSSRGPNQHSTRTSLVLHQMCRFFCAESLPVLDLRDSVAPLIAAQAHYLGVGYDLSIGQAFPLKSTIQALFVEAAFLLHRNANSASGWNRLLAANMLGSRYIYGPASEGYAELLHAVFCDVHFCKTQVSPSRIKERRNLRILLESAMQFGRHERLNFLKTVARSNRKPQLGEMIEISRLIPTHSPAASDWSGIREFLTRCDAKFQAIE